MSSYLRFALHLSIATLLVMELVTLDLFQYKDDARSIIVYLYMHNFHLNLFSRTVTNFLKFGLLCEVDRVFGMFRGRLVFITVF